MLTKICTRCKQNKPLEQYYLHPKGIGGRATSCKECHKLYNAAHKEQRRQWERANYAKNKGYELQKRRDWKKNNLEKWRPKHLDDTRTRRARKKGLLVDKDITLNALYLCDESICQICGEVCTRGDASVDHIIPLIKGGLHAWGNVQLAHIKCNCSKGSKII